MKQPMAVGIYGRYLKVYLKYLLNEVSQMDGGKNMTMHIYLIYLKISC